MCSAIQEGLNTTTPPLFQYCQVYVLIIKWHWTLSTVTKHFASSSSSLHDLCKAAMIMTAVKKKIKLHKAPARLFDAYYLYLWAKGVS